MKALEAVEVGADVSTAASPALFQEQTISKFGEVDQAMNVLHGQWATLHKELQASEKEWKKSQELLSQAIGAVSHDLQDFQTHVTGSTKKSQVDILQLQEGRRSDTERLSRMETQVMAIHQNVQTNANEIILLGDLVDRCRPVSPQRRMPVPMPGQNLEPSSHGHLLNLLDQQERIRAGEGVRITQPQTLPACLAGKTLYPHVCFKNITVQTNFGPPLMPLPFKCHMVGQAPATDAVVGIEPAPNGTYEVLFPIAIPDEGTFDWLDDFLKKNPRYVELSDRAMGEWAERSGVFRNKNYSWKHCNDKPDLQTGLPLLDDFSARKILGVVAPTQPRNYVVMEIKSNLLRDERQLFIRRFKRPGFKVVAQVMMGEPPAEFKAEVHKILLEEKQKKADEEWQQRKAQREAERVLRAREKEMEEVRRKAEEEALARAQAEATAQAEAVKAQLMAQGGVTEIAATEPAVPSVEIIDDGDAPSAQATPNAPVPPGEVKHEKPDVVMTEAKETKPPEKKAEEPPEEPRPVVTLSEEEKAICFKQKATSDLTSWTLGGHFTRFSLPEADEGFDEIRYEYLHKWIIKNKILCRMEDILPSDWFHSKAAEWQKVLADWHSHPCLLDRVP
eukprot:g2924.t1